MYDKQSDGRYEYVGQKEQICFWTVKLLQIAKRYLIIYALM